MKTVQYSSDKPIDDPAQDVFNRSAFASRLAKTLIDIDGSDGYVIGLYSQWGYGKTSVLNMIHQELNQDDSIVVLKFNPWVFTNQRAMVSGFFDLLADGLSAKLTTKKEDIAKFIKKYSKLINPISATIGDIGVAGGIAEQGADLMGSPTIEDLKERIEKIIAEADKRLVVIIDDVDRLDKDEIFQLFKLVKIAVDFKRVSYIIAFDDVVVGKILAERFPGSLESGQSFIEKIIQVPLHLPLIERNALDRYIFSGLEKLLKELRIDINTEEASRFRSIFDEHIAFRVDSPRVANRYLNSLKFILPLVGEEINGADLLIVEALRLTYPEEYQILRTRKKLLTGTARGLFVEDDDFYRQMKEEVSSLFGEKSSLISILQELFPEVENAYRQVRHNVDRKALKIAQRVSSVDYFDRYFTYGIPMDDLSDTRVIELLRTRSQTTIITGLRELISGTNSDTLMDKLHMYINEVSDPIKFISALVTISNELPDPPMSGFRSSPQERSVDLIIELIRKSRENRPKNLISAISRVKSIDLLTYLVREIRLESEDKKPEPLLTEADLNNVMNVAVERIENFAKRGKVLHQRDSRLAIHLYSYWAQIAGKNVVSTYLTKHIVSFEDAVSFITAYTSIWYGKGPPHHGNIDTSAFAYLCQVIDPQHLADIMKAHDSQYATSSETYPEFDDGVSTVGNEKDPSFIRVLVGQFMYNYYRQDERKDVS